MVKANLENFRKRFLTRWQNLYASFRRDGFAGLAGRITQHIQWLREFRARDTRFDSSMGVDTKGPVELWRLQIGSKNARYATRYEAVDPEVLRLAFADIHEEFRNFTFIDIGCGKGRAILLAAGYGFARLIGVEFAPRLAETAKHNCDQLKVQAEIHAMDAATFQFPEGNLVTFMYNPFAPEVLNPVIDNILSATAATHYVMYVNPKYSECFVERPRMQRIVLNGNYGIWKVVPVSG